MLSIIIPVLNEATTIKNLLDFLSENSSGENEIEIIVVDGGSSDGTQQIIKTFTETTGSVSFLTSEKGRAKQMNKGSREASGEILYFLHADSFPPKKFRQIHYFRS